LIIVVIRRMVVRMSSSTSVFCIKSGFMETEPRGVAEAKQEYETVHDDIIQKPCQYQHNGA
jgi:hypothetical protein